MRLRLQDEPCSTLSAGVQRNDPSDFTRISCHSLKLTLFLHLEYAHHANEAHRCMLVYSLDSAVTEFSSLSMFYLPYFQF